MTEMPKVYLNQRIITKGRAGQGRSGSQETRVGHLFHSFANGQDQRGIDKGHDNVRVKLIWNKRRERDDESNFSRHKRSTLSQILVINSAIPQSERLDLLCHQDQLGHHLEPCKARKLVLVQKVTKQPVVLLN